MHLLPQHTTSPELQLTWIVWIIEIAIMVNVSNVVVISDLYSPLGAWAVLSVFIYVLKMNYCPGTLCYVGVNMRNVY